MIILFTGAPKLWAMSLWARRPSRRRESLIYWALVLAITVLLVACTRTAPRERPEPERVLVISVVGTNDLHGHIERLPMLAGYVNNLRRALADEGGVLLVDAGDMLHGTLDSNLSEGAAVIAAYNAMGYAAASVGNHEFDFGPDGPSASPRAPTDDPQGALKTRIGEASFPFVSANLTTSDGAPPEWRNLHRSVITEIAGVRIGLIGLLTIEASEIIKRPNFTGLSVHPLAEAVKREARELRAAGAEVVVVLAHAGGECSRFEDARDLSSCRQEGEIFQLARSLPQGLIDVIVGGHRHKAVAHFVAGIPVVQAYYEGVAFSRVDLLVDPVDRRIVDVSVFPPQELCGEGGPEGECVPFEYAGSAVVNDRKISRLLEPHLERAREHRVATIGVVLETKMVADKSAECALGNLFVDLMRQAIPGADAAFSNGGSLRSDLPAGPLTYGALHRAMPFDNGIAVLRLTGSELRKLVAANVSGGRHGPLSLSGLRAKVRCRGGAIDVALYRQDGSRVPDESELIVVTSDFLALGGDGLLTEIDVGTDKVNLSTGLEVRDALISGLRNFGRSVRSDDPALFDPSRPRLDVPGPLPLVCPADRSVRPYGGDRKRDG